MTQLSLNPGTNFYATASEIAHWLRDCHLEHAFAYVFSKIPERLTTKVDWGKQGEIVRAVQQHTALLLATDALNLDVSHVNQLAFQNPESLLIELPHRHTYGLSYGALVAGTKVRRPLRRWQAIAKALEERTAAGVWYGAPGRPKPLYDPKVRYTPGAAALLAKGVPLLGGGLTRVVRLGTGRKGDVE